MIGVGVGRGGGLFGNGGGGLFGNGGGMAANAWGLCKRSRPARRPGRNRRLGHTRG